MRLKTNEHTILVIPDMQIPFHHKDSVAFLKAVKDAYSPDIVINIGDSLDQHALSNYTKDPDGFSARTEYEKSLPTLQKLYEVFESGIEVQSNHNERLYLRAKEAGIPREFLLDMKTIQKAPEGWDFVKNCEIGGIRFEHGDNFGGIHAARDAVIVNRKSTVIGHHHSHGGVYYVANDSTMLFGMNVGCLIDIDAYAFSYAKKFKFKPTLGCGIVLNGVPHFIPMVIGRRGRWIGSI